MEEEKDDYKKMQMSQQFQYDQKAKKFHSDKEKQEIKEMVDLFYADLKSYQIGLVLMENEKVKAH